MGQPKDSEFKDRDTMTLDLDDGGKLECIVLNVFPVNNREYIALLPMNDEGHVEEGCTDLPVSVRRTGR